MSSIRASKRHGKRICVLSCALLCAAAAGGASAAGDRPFSFREAGYLMVDDDDLNSAKAFIAAQLPAGLSQAEAVARLARAGMDCERRTAADGLNCVYWVSTTDKWTVHVALKDDGTVGVASVDYERIGFEDH